MASGFAKRDAKAEVQSLQKKWLDARLQCQARILIAHCNCHLHPGRSHSSASQSDMPVVSTGHHEIHKSVHPITRNVKKPTLSECVH